MSVKKPEYSVLKQGDCYLVTRPVGGNPQTIQVYKTKFARLVSIYTGEPVRPRGQAIVRVSDTKAYEELLLKATPRSIVEVFEAYTSD